MMAIAIIGVARSLLEIGTLGQSAQTISTSLLTSLTFYLYMFTTITALTAWLLKRRFSEIANLTSIGLVFGLLPPLIDLFFPGAQPQRYIFFTSFTWSLQSPQQPFSETATLWLLIVCTGWFVGYVSRSAWRAIMASIGVWGIMQALTALVLLINNSLRAASARQTMLSLALIGVSLAVYVIAHWQRFLPSLTRANHTLPHVGLALCGAFWIGSDLNSACIKAAIIGVVFTLLIAHNDYFDRQDDRMAGRSEGASADDVWWTSGLLVLIAWSFTRSLPALPWLLALIVLLGFAYHHGAIRLKARFCLSYKVEGGWALLAFLAGATTSSGFPIEAGLAWPGLLIFAGGSLLSFPKDYKDVEADKAANIPTIYVLAGLKGISPRRTHTWVTLAVTLAMLLGVALLAINHKPGLFSGLAALAALGSGAALWFTSRPKQAVEWGFWGIGLYCLILSTAIYA
jgi:hypothetical protein